MAQLPLLVLVLVFSACGLRASLLKGFPECNSWFEEILEYTVDPQSFANGANAAQVNSAEECQNICCTTKECDLAVVENNGQGLQCHLVNCAENGVDGSCLLASHPNFNSYRRHAADCIAPPAVGPCRASFPRFFFNSTSQSCQLFIYGGCPGNDNNYLSMEDCQSFCGQGTVLPQVLTNKDEDQNKVTEDTTAYAEYCLTEPVGGFCKASMPRYFYNSNAKMCQTFIYGGCMGNKNNYLTKEECQAKCAETVAPKAVTENIPEAYKEPVAPKALTENIPEAYKERCMVKRETGPCRASFMNWYFDPVTKNCLSFTYGGCQGNQNRYGSVEECMDSCAAGPAAYNYDQPGHNVQTHYSKVVFLAAVLSIMTVLLVIGLILISVKRIKSHQVIVKEDKEELLPAHGHNDSA
ncbi:kunitz-type protease inhibitor 2 isoform X2 [Erpetoichthys calabaricus]|uniref:Serine peptidase inhibitor, Kunitz type, 2 n=1 Tax=Erpetoichthys calabaricus TaxID=27687 RepID=A0A8C4RGB3_ERPCA|nr:kunitz-type protease inhibitor 2 isoform X2 [Erpetoichthys calabaricus]